jgi:mannitol-specific phosphotransferase system IIBC component
MNNYITANGTLTHTISGTLLALLLQVNSSQLISTIVVAATGAITSFLVSIACKALWNFLKRDKEN